MCIRDRYCTDMNIPFFFAKVASNFDELKVLKDCGVSDIYIGNDLGFYLSIVKAIVNDINIRVYPNIAQSTIDGIDDIYKFFVPTECALRFDEYIDVYEFYSLDYDKRTDADYLYKIYAELGQWAGPIKEYILNLSEDCDIDTNYWLSIVGDHRGSCQKKCLKGNGCNICGSSIELMKTMKAEEQKILTK